MILRAIKITVVLMIAAAFGLAGTNQVIVPVMAAEADGNQPRGIQLDRVIEKSYIAPGEITDVRFELTNRDTAPVEYTLIEEVSPRLAVVDTDGSFNATAGFVVWRGTIGVGETTSVYYATTLTDQVLRAIPLYAYANTTTGESVENSATISPVHLPITLSLDETAVRHGQVGGAATNLRLIVDNPFDRSIDVDLQTTAASGLTFSEPLAFEGAIDAGGQVNLVIDVKAEEPGRYPVSVTPLIGGRPAGETRQVTLTVYDGDRSAMSDLQDFSEAPSTDVSTPGSSRRSHKISLPDEVVLDGDPMVLIVELPEGSSFVPGTTLINGEAADDPLLRQEHMHFYIDPENEIQLSYALRYADREQMNRLIRQSDKTDGIGLISLGAFPNLLFGDDYLLTLLDTSWDTVPREREGVVILYPFSEQTLTNQRHTDVEVDAPTGSKVSLSINGELISEDRVGAVAEDVVLGRLASKYISVPLESRVNQLVARALTEDGETLVDEIVVYRSGSPAVVSIDPITELATERVQPIVFQITVTDEDGLPPANGTDATVKVEGGLIASEDAHPNWIGHQVLLYNGRAFIAIEPPAEATELVFEVSVGQLVATERFMVTSQVDEWMVIGHGSAKIDGIGNASNDAVSVETSLRVFAQGPFMYDSVLTLAVNTSEPEDLPNEDDIWTGDTSETGVYGEGSGTVFARMERGLSYAQYGQGNVNFDGMLSGLNKRQRGMQFEWNESPLVTLRGFYADEAVDIVQETLDADGTGYFRLQGRNIERYSEDISIVVRDHRHPNEVVRVMRLAYGRYYLDYATGQLILTEPLPSIDEWGNKVTLRVRYRTEGDKKTVGIGGIQGVYDTGSFLVRGTAFNKLIDGGDSATLIGLGTEVSIGGYDLALEIAGTRVNSGSGSPSPGATFRGASAFSLSVKRADLFGWSIAADHRRVDHDFAGDDTTVKEGISTSLRADKVFLNGLGITAATSTERAHDGDPSNRETSIDTRWDLGKIRPEIGLIARSGDAKPNSLSVRAGVGGDLPHGSLGYYHERPLSGEARVANTLEARLDMSRYQMMHFSWQSEREKPGAPVTSKVGFGMTHSLEGDRTNTRFHGGYELPTGTSLAEGRVVLGAQTEFTVDERNRLNLSVDHRRPLVPTMPSGFGSSVGWTHRYKEVGESELRFDYSDEGVQTKYALNWRGLHQVSDAFTLRGHALYTTDQTGDERTRWGAGGAYRVASLVILGNIASDYMTTVTGNTSGSEWRLQAASELTPKLIGNIGYAKRETTFESIAAGTSGESSTTDKWTVGGRLRISNKLELLLEGSALSQRETNSMKTGGMLGIGVEVLDNLWFTLGYGTSEYVAYDHAGDRFSTNRSGPFVQIDWAFDEWSLRRLFSGKDRAR